MAGYNKQQLNQFALEKLPDNNSNEIYPEDLREVLSRMLDQLVLSSYVKFENTFLGSNTLQQALDELVGFNLPQWLPDRTYPGNYFVAYGDDLYRSKYLIPAGGSSPPLNSNWSPIFNGIKIRDLLVALEGDQRLPFSAIKGFPLEEEICDFVAIYQNIHKTTTFSVLQGSTVKLEDRSLMYKRVIKFKWEIHHEDGIYPVMTSYNRNPEFTFPNLGNHNVNLYLYNSSGEIVSSKSVDNFIQVYEASLLDYNIYWDASNNQNLTSSDVLSSNLIEGVLQSDEIAIPFNNSSDQFIWFACPANYSYNQFKDAALWTPIENNFDEFAITLGVEQWRIYMSKYPTIANTVYFRKV